MPCIKLSSVATVSSRLGIENIEININKSEPSESYDSEGTD